MATGLEDGSASRNATLGTAGAIWPLPMVMRPRPRVPSHVLTNWFDLRLRSRTGRGCGLMRPSRRADLDLVRSAPGGRKDR